MIRNVMPRRQREDVLAELLRQRRVDAGGLVSMISFGLPSGRGRARATLCRPARRAVVADMQDIGLARHHMARWRTRARGGAQHGCRERLARLKP
jgi:hypothetical protein